jgi:hypothetical protein
MSTGNILSISDLSVCPPRLTCAIPNLKNAKLTGLCASESITSLILF